MLLAYRVQAKPPPCVHPGTPARLPAAQVPDSAGNWNNVMVIPEPPPVLTSREGLALARWHAAHLALEAKMGLPPPATS